MPSDSDIHQLLLDFGLSGDDLADARGALEEAGLTRPGKVRIADSKRDAIDLLLHARYFRVCGVDQARPEVAMLAAGRRTIGVAREYCDVCGGSPNSQAIERMVESMLAKGRSRLLIVGGTPVMEQELTAAIGKRLDVRFVLKEQQRNSRQAAQERAWADVAVIIASTPIAHKVTMLYQGPRTITVAQRGMAALAEAVITTIERGVNAS